MNKNRRFGTENFITINGKRVDIYSAKIVYRCEECHASLAYRGSGLTCSEKRNHRGFIHRAEVAKIIEQQQHNIDDLEKFYEIKNGKVVIKNVN